MEVGTAAIAMRPVGKHPKYQHHNFADRAEPAYPGANFDNDGFCVVHSTVRLCELREDGRYKIVRKLCYKCGNTAIISKVQSGITPMHGYKRKDSLRRRNLPNELVMGSNTHFEWRHKHDEEAEVEAPHVNICPTCGTPCPTCDKHERIKRRDDKVATLRQKQEVERLKQKEEEEQLRRLIELRRSKRKKENDGDKLRICSTKMFTKHNYTSKPSTGSNVAAPAKKATIPEDWRK